MYAWTRWVGVAGLVGLTAAAGAQDRAAMACDAHLSAAQRLRFTLALQGCAPSEPERRKAPASVHADALVATELTGLAAELPARESAHLQLFGRPGVVSSRIGAAVPMAAPTATPVPATRAGGPKRPAKPPSAAVRRALTLSSAVDDVARRHDIDPLLLHAIAYVESRHDARAVSPAGARGVMQVMPATAKRFGVAQAQSLDHAGTNLEVSASYLKTLQGRFGTDLPLVLAAYNAGEGAVERYGRRVPPFAETQSYVRQVLAQYRALGAAAGRPADLAAD